MLSPTERLKARWSSERITIRPGISPERLDAFEAKYRVVLQPALRDYFAGIDGTGNDADDNMYRFWEFDDFVPLSEYREGQPGVPPWADRWFLFADILIESDYFAVRLSSDPTDDGPVAIPIGATLISVSPTFAGFLDLYLASKKDRLLECGTVEIEG